MPQSKPSIAIGENGRISGTLSAAANISSKPSTIKRVWTGFWMSLTRACNMVTQVPSVPTKARATLKLFSGKSWSRL